MGTRINDKFKKELSQWIALEERLKNQNKTANEIRKHKNVLEESLLEYMKKNNLGNTALNLGTMSVVPSKGSQLPPLNIDFIREVLIEILGNRETTEKIVSRIVRKRESLRRETFSLKYKKTRSIKKKKV